MELTCLRTILRDPFQSLGDDVGPEEAARYLDSLKLTLLNPVLSYKPEVYQWVAPANSCKSFPISRSGYEVPLEETVKLLTTKLLPIVLASWLLTGLAMAEDGLPPKVVRVVGTAEVKVVPDRAVIEIGVEKQDPSAGVAKHAEDAAARRILSALRDNGIDDKDIQTTFLSLQPQSYTRKGVRISYFVAAQTMTITVRDLAKLDSLLETLIKAGGNRIDSIGYETSDLRKYRDRARDEAVKAAREKAGALAKALGQDIGKAQSIEEVPEPEFTAANASFNDVRAKAEAPSIAVGQKSIFASVTVSFELN